MYEHDSIKVSAIAATSFPSSFILKLIASNMALWLIFLPLFMSLLSGSADSLLVPIIGMLLIPVWIFLLYMGRIFLYVFWRFFWHIIAYLWTFGTVLFLAIVAVGFYTGQTFLGQSLSISSPAFTNILILLVISIPIMFVITRLSRRVPVEIADSNLDEGFVFQEEAAQQAIKSAPRKLSKEEIDTKFLQDVCQLISAQTAYRVEIQNSSDLYVYEDSNIVGFVRCKRLGRRKPLAPLFIQEVHKQKQRLNVRFAYLVTNSYFTNDAINSAKDLGIRLMDGRLIRHHQNRIA